MKSSIVNLIALALLLLVTGLFCGTWFALTRSIEDFSAPEFIHIGKVIIGNVGSTMPIIFTLCIAFMIWSLWRYPKVNRAGFYSGILAVTLIIITLIITVGIEVPIDNQIKTWTETTVPGDWEAIRSRWNFYHTVRTMTSLLSFIFFSLAIFFRNNTSG